MAFMSRYALVSPVTIRFTNFEATTLIVYRARDIAVRGSWCSSSLVTGGSSLLAFVVRSAPVATSTVRFAALPTTILVVYRACDSVLSRVVPFGVAAGGAVPGRSCRRYRCWFRFRRSLPTRGGARRGLGCDWCTGVKGRACCSSAVVFPSLAFTFGATTAVSVLSGGGSWYHISWVSGFDSFICLVTGCGMVSA